MEHFVTLFDRNFLPSGICLYYSIKKYHKNFTLWILCMDDEVWFQLNSFQFDNIKTIKLSEIETEILLKLKKERNWTEYCWTLTPFTPKLIFEKDPSITRVTYLDADLYFFDSTVKIFNEFEKSGGDVLITRHDYASQYDKSKKSGIYCVQFMIFKNTKNSNLILSWWQEKCIEWCFNRYEDGKFGDQKYLDDWPFRFGNSVHVLSKSLWTLAPWNLIRHVDLINKKNTPILFHFHGLRIISKNSIRLCFGYKIPEKCMNYYCEYIELMISVIFEIKNKFGYIPIIPEQTSIKFLIKKKLFQLLGLVKYKFF